jgi:hypothetical protein
MIPVHHSPSSQCAKRGASGAHEAHPKAEDRSVDQGWVPIIETFRRSLCSMVDVRPAALVDVLPELGIFFVCFYVRQKAELKERWGHVPEATKTREASSPRSSSRRRWRVSTALKNLSELTRHSRPWAMHWWMKSPCRICTVII